MMRIPEEVEAARNSLWGELSTKEEIEGVGIGERDGEYLLNVYVSSAVLPGGLVPSSYRGFPVKVIRSGSIRMHGDGLGRTSNP